MDPKGAAEGVDRRMALLAGRQWGVVARRQLLGLGFSEDQVKARVAGGRLHPVHRGVYAVGHRLLTWRGRFLAAAFACGPDAVVSHRSAGILHGFLPLSSQAVDVSVLGRHRAQRGLILHHPRALAPTDITVTDAVPVTAPMRTLADLAALLGADALERAVRQAERHRLLDVRALNPHLRPGRTGTANLRAVLAGFDEGVMTREELERRFFALTKKAKLLRPQANVQVDRFVVDFLWPSHGLVVETDGWKDHGTRSAFEQDRARDVVLAQLGLRVVRFTWRQIGREPAGVAAALAQLLRGSSPPSATPWPAAR